MLLRLGHDLVGSLRWGLLTAAVVADAAHADTAEHHGNDAANDDSHENTSGKIDRIVNGVVDVNCRG